MSTADRRLQRAEAALEARFGPEFDTKRAEREAKIEREIDAWEALIPTMGPYGSQVEREYVELLQGERLYTKHVASDDPRPKLSALIMRAHSMVLDVVLGKHEGPLAMPPEVCKVLLADPQAHLVQDCEDCGLKLPLRFGGGYPGSMTPPYPAVKYFEHCPLCGGRVLNNGYRKKHEPGFYWRAYGRHPEPHEVTYDVAESHKAAKGRRAARP